LEREDKSGRVELNTVCTGGAAGKSCTLASDTQTLLIFWHPKHAAKSLSYSDLTSILFLLLVLVTLAHMLGYAFSKLRQPKVVGEILAGVLVGPAILGRFSVTSWITSTANRQADVLNFVYWLGLLLLMFLSGAETQRLFTREERREVGWLTIVGTGIPFVLALVLGPWLVRPSLAGPNGNRASLMIILAVGVAVTSVPVVSKIFADLKILHTRFARLVLGVAVVEDIILWLAVAVATALAGKSAVKPPTDVLPLVGHHRFFRSRIDTVSPHSEAAQ
jgi:Kef-type K+ transport system membrane component KefB